MRVRAGFEEAMAKFAADDKAISVEIQGFEARIKEAEALMKAREKEKLGTKATLAALEIELNSSTQQVLTICLLNRISVFIITDSTSLKTVTLSSLLMLMPRPKAGYRLLLPAPLPPSSL